MNRTIANVLQQDDLDDSVLLGYYGGGNFGDELLLEVLMNLFTENGVRSLTIAYLDAERFSTYHHDFGYDRIDMANKWVVFTAILKNKNVIVGGGGLWGLDVNMNIFIFSSLLFISRFILRKKVYLLGVGYYNSTNKLGHVSAWLASKSAHHTIARDVESLRNFQKVNSRVTLDADIAYHVPSLDLKPYQQDFAELDKTIHIDEKTLFITLRRFKPHQTNTFTKNIEAYLAKNQAIQIIVATLEPREIDPDGYALINKWQKQYQNVQALDFSYNPVALYLFFEKHKKQLALIGPQFHVIIMALLTGVPFLPVVYDNKVRELLKQTTTLQPIEINELSQKELEIFIHNFKHTTE